MHTYVDLWKVLFYYGYVKEKREQRAMHSQVTRNYTKVSLNNKFILLNNLNHNALLPAWHNGPTYNFIIRFGGKSADIHGFCLVFAHIYLKFL